MNKQKQIIVLVLTGLLIALVGCNETHAQKKQAMIQEWEQTTASAQLPAIQNLFEQGQIQKAKQELAKCIQGNPELPGAYVLVGRIHFMEGRNDQARQAFQQAIELDPQLDQAWHFLGSLAVLEKNYTEAVTDFQKAIDLMPAKTEYLISLSDVYTEMNELDKAQQVIDAGLEKESRNLELILSKARLFQQVGNLDEAIRIYEQALLIHGDLPEILEPVGYAYIAQKQWAKAAEKFANLMNLYTEADPRYNITMRSLASCLLNSNQYGSALLWYDKLSVVYRDDAEIWLDMAQASLGLDDPKRASYCAINALKTKPSWPKAYAVLGSARYMQGLYEQSLQAFYKITDDSELAAFAWFMSGRCYQQLGQNRQANAAFEKAEQLDPDNELIALFMKKTIHPL
jgi:tetratricopeptide (TPR) repeat protein